MSQRILGDQNLFFGYEKGSERMDLKAKGNIVKYLAGPGSRNNEKKPDNVSIVPCLGGGGAQRGE